MIAGDMLSDMLAEWSKSTPRLPTAEQYPLCHPDLSVNNIFINDRNQITCLIDWEFVSTVPISVLLTALGLPQSRNSLEGPLVAAFEEGFNTAVFDTILYQNRQESQALCRLLRCSRPIWLVCRFFNFDSIEDFTLFRALSESLGPKDKGLSDSFRARQATPHYRHLYQEMKQEDQTPELISRQEKQYFRRDSEIDKTIARKLKMVSDWYARYEIPIYPSSQVRHNCEVFVADCKLWRWIGSCLKDLHRDED